MSDIRKFLQGGGDAEKAESKRDFDKRKSQQAVYDKTKRSRTVQDAWFSEYSWASMENGTLSCSVCRAYPALSDSDSSLVKGVTGKFRKETLKYHDKSIKHVKCIGKQRAELNPNVTEMAKSMKSLDEKNSIKYENCLILHITLLKKTNHLVSSLN